EQGSARCGYEKDAGHTRRGFLVVAHCGILSADITASATGVSMKPFGLRLTVASAVVFLLAASIASRAQSGLPNPYRPVKGLADGGGSMVPGADWARLPGGREMGPP